VLIELWKNDLGKYLVKVRVGFYSVISEFWNSYSGQSENLVIEN
jgi:hypothetical protein